VFFVPEPALRLSEVCLGVKIRMNLAIIIVSYNQPDAVARLLNSLERQTYTEYSIIIVDNNSDAAVKDYLEKLLPQCRVFFLDNNFGYAAACNLGIKKAIEQGCGRFLVVNQDVELEEHAVGELVKACRDDYGIVAPIVLYGNDKKSQRIIHTYGMHADFRQNRMCLMGENTSLKLPTDLSPLMVTNMFNGAAFLVSKEAIEKAGFFDETYFMYGEEMDYAYRLAATGLKIVTIAAGIVWHHHDWSKNNKDNHHIQYYYIMRNRMLYFKKYGLWLSLVKDVAYNCISFPAKLKWAQQVFDAALLKYYYWGIIKGLLGEQGRSKAGI
jgi:GT2 family glycosyltransferase